jgi:23S rRNA-/tRNA-specific pseudouridylate synthase
MESDRIGIPANLLSRDKGLRIPIEHWGDGLLVFDKPQSIAAKADPWYPEYPDLERCFNAQIPLEKPELKAHGISQMSILNSLEPEVTGAVLATINEDNMEHWKNQFGSFQFSFHFLLISKKSTLTNDGSCDLPIVRHFKNQHMMVSHRLGKKAFTQFSLLDTGRDAQAWLASTRYPRLHQIRIHCREQKIRLLNDPRYDPDYPESSREEDLHKLDWVHCFAVASEPNSLTSSPIAYSTPPKYWKRNLRKSGLEIDSILEKSRHKIKNMTLPIE